MKKHSEAQAKGYPTLVVGLGKTGLSCARFLAARGESFAVADSRTAPPELETLRRELPGVPYFLGDFDSGLFSAAGRLLLSPGVALEEPAIAAARQQGVPLLGDIELFTRQATAPVVAITGSNGKSTVSTLLWAMARQAGRQAQLGGNIGTPALELLNGQQPELYVLELSSFQLELTESLNARAAVVLNVSADHLDRHSDLAAYAAIKQRVYRGDGVMVINADDPQVAAMAEAGRNVVRFSLDQPATDADFGLRRKEGETWLARGRTSLLPVSELRIPGRHNQANALAALALGEALGLPMAAMLSALRRFTGLPHRCQWLGEYQGVNWYNDSKGTNVGATLTALQGLPGKKVVLIAGGLGKGADFSPLRPVVTQRVRAVVLIGTDAPRIEQALAGSVPLVHAGDLAAAAAAAAGLAEAGDSVLFSPACASFDMFENFEARGDAFMAEVERLRT